ncbi:MMPL family transporter [Dactylosporangium sp. AC04546]|uniref:MMPL family transporter n=1 Tax=Dactylosporangium sp. AC04546 TaxID=2862460 RepID=UPI001EDCE5B0|nr:MMPL family transporter [Dactylosporangium sp. AC04546]WVK89011.1 MMPL family transporter [Dactylosporangium sp. AC04546]
MSVLARWCVRHRKTVLAGWLLMVVGLLALVMVGGTAFKTSAEMPDSESSKAYALLARMSGGGGEATTTGKIAWHATAGSVTSAQVQQEIGGLLDEVGKQPGVVSVVSPYSEAGARQVAASADTAYAQVILRSDADVGGVESVLDNAQLREVELTYGGTAFDHQPEPSHGGEAVGLIVALVLLMLMFRSWWASWLPLVTGIVGVVVSLLLVAVGSHVVTLDSTSITMASMMGLAVGIDYALFIVNRTRKGLLAGQSVADAVAHAVDTSGRAVVFAGLTVIVALAGIRVVGMGVLTGMGEAAAVTVACTVLAALTLLPALMGQLGVKVLSKRQRAQLAEGVVEGVVGHHRPGGLAAGWARFVQRAPWLVVPLALAVVVVLAAPVLQMRVGDADASSDPSGSRSHRYAVMTSSAFGSGFDNPLVVAASTPDAPSQQAFAELAGRMAAVPGVVSVTPVSASADGTVGTVTVIPASSAQAAETAELIERLRGDVIPSAEAGTGLRAYVGGKAASSQDLADALLGRLPLYLGIIAVLGFLLLAVAFRSFLVPLVGALSNITSILVGLGAITAVFQFGWGSELMRVGSGAPIMYIVPVMIVGIVFGLSMDYQVFLVSRMHEEWTHTGDNRRAVRVGVTETGRVIATAALIMVGVFASFAFGGQRIVSAIGVGLAVAVLIDAFVVRLTLIPALMTVLGPRNWWYPRWAQKITPRVAVEGTPQAQPAPEREPVTVG